ncbi:MAG: hypothetical protein LBN06_05025 [Prevotellaceae bacterium]|jgi:hypothetical protein|nr:hypothetical protein [Prevotellaceae bacterium]
MKNALCYLVLLPITLCAMLTGCKEAHDDVAPGLYTAQMQLATFPGDTTLVSGQASNYVGISSITLACEAWGIHKVYDLSAQKPTVFNYNYQLIVPTTATFDQTLTVTVADKNGLSTQKTVPIAYLPDTQKPTLTTALPSQVSVDFDSETGSGTWNVSLAFADDRGLKSVSLQIPDAGVDESSQLSGRSATFARTINFTGVGTYTATLILTDDSDNATVVQTDVVVMLVEEEDPVSDYPQMFVFSADENPDDYIDGYYHYMDRQGAYQYQGKIYAATDNAQFFFAPTESVTGDLFGASPYVGSKLMNKNGYVVPIVVPTKGYYGIYIDLQAHTFSTWALDTSAALTGIDFIASGEGFTIGDWGLSGNMTPVDTYIYQIELEQTADPAKARSFYFSTPDWAHVFRADAEGYWWYESASGSVATYKSDYAGPVILTLDTAIPWGTIKKKVNN